MLSCPLSSPRRVKIFLRRTRSTFLSCRTILANPISSHPAIFLGISMEKFRDLRASGAFILVAMCLSSFTDTFVYGMVRILGQGLYNI